LAFIKQIKITTQNKGVIISIGKDLAMFTQSSANAEFVYE